jgi:excisionase family DNA binding protein
MLTHMRPSKIRQKQEQQPEASPLTGYAASLPKLGLGVVEAAQALGIGRTKTLELIHAGKLGYVRVGKRIIVPVREVEKFLEREAGGEGE